MVISMPRGDIRDVRFVVHNYDGTGTTDIDFDEIYVSFKTSTNTPNLLFQKKLTDGTITKEEPGVYQFRIEPEDTDSLRIGNYAFDIELVYENLIKQTTVGVLEITPEVTYAENE